MKDGHWPSFKEDGLNISGVRDITFMVGHSGMDVASDVDVDNVNSTLGF